jgi:hypothetical protein
MGGGEIEDRPPPPSRPLGTVAVVYPASVAARRPEAGSGGDRERGAEGGEEERLRPGLTSSSLRSTGSGRRWGRWAVPEVGERVASVGSSVGLCLGEPATAIEAGEPADCAR